MKQNVIILGGGIIGVTLGYFLARAGMRPILLEPGEIAGGTSAASFAWANATSKTTDAAYHQLNVRGMAGYRALAQEYGAGKLGIARTGALHIVAADDAAGLSEMHRQAAKLVALGYTANVIQADELAAREPDLRLGRDMQAMHLPDDMVIDAPHFTRFLAARMVEMGGEIRHIRATGILADDLGHVHGVECDTGDIQAAAVICATGQDTGQTLTDLTGYAPFASRFPVRKVPGLILTTPSLPRALPRHLVYSSARDEIHFLPTQVDGLNGAGGLRMGSDDIDALIWERRDPDTLAQAGRALLERAARFLPGLADQVDIAACALAVGIRPYPEDGHSLIGALPGTRGLYVIATHSGITLAPVIGEYVARWISTGDQPAALKPYGLSRFAGFGPD